jgi:hypothetical protein
VSRRPAAGNSRTRRLLNNALDLLGVKHDTRFNPGIPELQRAERALYGSFSHSDDILQRWNQVLIATALMRDQRHPLNVSRSYLRLGIRALDRGDISLARGYFRSAGWEQDKYRASI